MIRAPGPWIVALATNVAVLGVLFEMTLKLGWIGGIALVVVGAAAGTAAGYAMLRRERRAAGAASGVGA